MEKTAGNCEILAPAGDQASLTAAVNAGADAVYFGVNDFNARAKCDNFSLENVAKVIKNAHLLGVKTYITLNTLVSDKEIPAFLSAVDVLYNAKADAFIVQDFGMGTLIKKLYPDAAIHASTQMGIHNADGAEFLEKCGYKRVILSRETKLDDIKRIKERTSLEIEYFVQGALCVAFSGNCYLSSIKDGNSGNRGRCRQLCRLKYSSEGKCGYLLSPNDLCLADKLDVLSAAGVDSFKIEGRMKRPSYVAAAVKAYVLARGKNLGENGKKSVDLAIDDLSRTFSRGKYDKSAYMFDNDDIIDYRYNNNTGVKIGFVTDVKPFKELWRVAVKCSSPLINGDGLRIVGKTETTLGVGSPEKTAGGEYRFVTAKSGIRVGDEVYKTLDVTLENELLSDRKLLPVKCETQAFIGKKAQMTLSFCDVSYTAIGDECEKAVKNPLDENGLKESIKFGDAPFYLESVFLKTDGVFMLKSALNALRRNAVDGLIEKIIKKNSPSRPPYHPSKERISEVISVYEDAANGLLATDNYVVSNDLNDLLNNENAASIFSPDDYNVLPKMPMIDIYGDFYLDLPIESTEKDLALIDKLITHLDGALNKKIGVVANNYYALKFLNERPVVIGTGLNVYNAVTGGAHLLLGAKDVFSSIELKGLKKFASYEGNPALMTLTHCPYKVSADSSCDNCKASRPLIYKDERENKYEISRKKLFYCYFSLKLANKKEYDSLVPKSPTARKVIDLRT